MCAIVLRDISKQAGYCIVDVIISRVSVHSNQIRESALVSLQITKISEDKGNDRLSASRTVRVLTACFPHYCYVTQVYRQRTSVLSSPVDASYGRVRLQRTIRRLP